MKSMHYNVRNSLLTKYLAASLGLAVASVMIPQSANAAIDTWSGGVSGAWDTATAGNWLDDGTDTLFNSGNDALFTAGFTNSVTSASGLTIGAITLDNTFTGSVKLTGNNTVNGATTISGGSLIVSHVGTNTGTVVATVIGTSAVTVNSGGLLYVDDEGNGTTGAERVLSLGNTILGSGTLQARASSLHTNGWSSVNFTGDLSGFTGTLNVVAGTTTNRGKVKFTAATQAQVLSSSATVNVANGGQLYLTQAYNYGFATHLNGGTGGEGNGSLRLDNAGLNVTGAVTLDASSTISGAGTISGNIGEAGGARVLTKVGNNITVLTGSNSYSGGTTVSAGTLKVGNSNALGTGAVSLSGGQIAFDASSSALTVNNNISGNTNGVWNWAPTNKITLGGTVNVAFNNNGNALNINAGAGGVDITGTVTTVGGAGTSGWVNVAGNTTVTIQPGGSFSFNTVGTPNSIVGQNAAGTSTIAVNGGAFTVGGNTGFALGNNRSDAIGVLTVSSGTASIIAGSATLQNAQNFVALGRDAATGIVNLDGGVLETGRQFVRDGSATANPGGGAGTATVNFNGGTLRALASQTGGNGWFETATTGNFQVVTTNVKDGGAKIDTNSFDVNVNTVLAHAGVSATDGGLTKSGAGTLTLGAVNTYTGNTTVNGGTLSLADNAGLKFVIGGNGVNNKIIGTGTVSLDGDFTFDLTGASTNPGDSWMIVDVANLNETFGATFSVLNAGAVENANIWSFTNGTTEYQFSETSGVLLVVPEPTSAAMLLGGIGMLGLLRRRKH